MFFHPLEQFTIYSPVFAAEFHSSSVASLETMSQFCDNYFAAKAHMIQNGYLAKKIQLFTSIYCPDRFLTEEELNFFFNVKTDYYRLQLCSQSILNFFEQYFKAKFLFLDNTPFHIKTHFTSFDYSYILISFFNNFNIYFFFVILILFSFFYLIFSFFSKLFQFWLLAFFQLFLIIGQIIKDLLLNIKGKIYFISMLYLLFFFLFFFNLSGLIPYSFAITSYFSVTFFFSFIFFFLIVLIGIYYHGSLLLGLFLPAGTPVIIMPLLILIELISYFARVFSLAIRLFANITAGHILLKILSGFIFILFPFFFVSFAGFFLICILWVLEFFISCLQAYVFLILLSIYLNEVLQLDH